MTDSAASRAGLDMHLDLGGARPGRALELALRDAIAEGRLDAGRRLPATRTLAADLGVARATVTDVYAQLVAEGWLEARTGSGTWVARNAEPAREASVTVPQRAQLQPAYGPGSLVAGLPDASSFPRQEWLAAGRRALELATDAELGYAPPPGVARLRTELASYLRRTRGVAAGPDDLLIGGGFGAVLAELCRALAEAGAQCVGVEAYGHAQHRDIVRAAGLEAIAVPVDDEGVQVPTSARIDALLLTPAHQFPLGVPLSAARRRALVAWAREYGALIIEDDYDGEFRYDRRSIGALQAVAPDTVAYLGTASKALGPAIGLAWAVLPARWRAETLRAREVHGAAPRDAINQLTLAVFLDEHSYDRHVRRMRAEYRRRRELLASLLVTRIPAASLGGVAAGLQATVLLPDNVDAREVVAAAARGGLRFLTLADYAADASATHPPAVVIGYGAPSRARADAELEAAVQAIASTAAG